MIVYCLVETSLLFVGTLLWFIIHSGEKQRKLVVTNLSQVFSSCFKQAPPPPILDPMMILRIGAFVLLALALNEKDAVIVVKSWWDDVIVYIWTVIADFGQIVVFFADLIIPLYNWVVTLNAQLTTGTYTIVAKCQMKTIVESLVYIGEAMQLFAKAMGKFILEPKGAFDIYDTAAAVQIAVMKQEVVIKCACDGITPALGIAFDVVRPVLLANIVNETVNALIAVPQTAVLAIPPWKEIPDGKRVFQPLKRLAVALGQYGDKVLDNIFQRILLKPTKIVPLLSIAGYAAEGLVGVAEMLAHTMTRIILLQPITFNPQHIHQSFINAADSLEYSTLVVLSAVAEPLNLGSDATASAIDDISDAYSNPILDAANAQASLVDDIQDAAKPLSRTVGYLTKAVVGLVMSVIDESYFILRGEHAGLSFMETLQRWDGEWGKQGQNGIRLQEHFFQNIDKATMAAEDVFDAFAFFPITLRIASRTANVLVRTALSAEDIIEDEFFHKPINCGYGTKDTCSDECQFYWNPNTQNPCNSLITEWIFEGVEDMIESAGGLFQKVRPQGEEWCNSKNYPSSPGGRCTVSNTDFFCASSVTIKEGLKVPLEQLRYTVQTALSIFAKSNDVKTLTFQDSLCGLSKVVYALAGNAVAVLPQEVVSASLKEKLTNLAHAVLVLPIEVIRFDLVLANFMLSIITGSSVNWRTTQQEIEDQLISSEYKRQAQSTTSTTTSIKLSEKTAQFVVTSTIIPMNYFINVFDALGDITGGSNFFSGVAEGVSVLKNALSKEMINLVALVFKVGSNLLALVTKGTTDVGELASDVITLLKKGIDIIATMASQILVNILKLLGPVGEFLILLWKGICAAGTAIEWLTGADFGDVCDAVDTVRRARMLLPTMQEHTVNMTGFHGNSECDLLVHHYNGRFWGEATYLEQVRLAHCAEQQAIVHKMNVVLQTDMPTDMVYNWKRKYDMAYEAAIGFVVYMKHQDSTQMLAEWDRLELPRYYLDIWHRVKIEIPWITILDDALIQTIQPMPELASMYDTTKDSLMKLRHVATKHDMASIQVPDIKLQEFKLGAAYHKVVSHHTMAWGLYTEVDLPPGRLNCTVADNFVRAMSDATDRVEQYYSGPFTESVLPDFMAWLQNVKVPRQYPDIKVPTLSIPTKQTAQDAVLYSFQKCHYEDIMCNPAEQLERVGRITESLVYVAYTMVGMALFSMITGISPFPLLMFTPLIVLAHTWNYRLTCTPNIPDCAFDDMYAWIQTYTPKMWDAYFPIMAEGGQCPENPLWSSAYLLAQSPINKIVEFVLYQNEDAYSTYQEWGAQTELKDECFWIKTPQLIYTPLMLYGVYAFSNTIMWGVNAIVSYITLTIPILSTIYALEN